MARMRMRLCQGVSTSCRSWALLLALGAGCTADAGSSIADDRAGDTGVGADAASSQDANTTPDAGGSTPEAAVPEAGAADASLVPSDAASEAATAAGAHQFQIRFDYRYDSMGFFADAQRRRLLEAAADVWRKLIRDDFATIPAHTPLLIHNLVDLAAAPNELMLDEPIDDLLIFVACSPDLDTEGVAGRTRRIANFPGAMGAAFQQMLMDRWRGANQEPWAVGITFACKGAFFFDPTPETSDDLPLQTQIDFLNTAMHEIGHALGFGASATFEALRSSDKKSFLGPKATALYGGPIPLAADASHMQDDLKFGGKRVLMDSDSSPGERDFPTPLDLAAFEDLGYQIAR